MAPRWRAQRTKTQRLLDVLVANSSPSPQPGQRRQLSISDEALIADVIAAFPTLTREEAISDLLLLGGALAGAGGRYRLTPRSSPDAYQFRQSAKDHVIVV
jgi:hypothetical protein